MTPEYEDNLVSAGRERDAVDRELQAAHEERGRIDARIAKLLTRKRTSVEQTREAINAAWPFMSADDVAEKVGLARNSVYQHLNEANRKLRRPRGARHG